MNFFTVQKVKTLREVCFLAPFAFTGRITFRHAKDLQKIDQYAGVADQLLIDAKPPTGSVLPGGNGLSFDWRLLAGRRWPVPWMLAGGLTPGNVAQAIRLTGASQVDVASGVEASPGLKDAAKVRAFIQAAKSGRGA